MSQAHRSSIGLAESFELIFAASPWPVLMLSEDGRFLGASDDRLQREPTGRIDLPLRESASHYFSMLEKIRPHADASEVDSVRTDGEGMPIFERVHVRRAAWGFCLTIVDETEARRLQIADIQSARLAALGFMVAGVCHEMTNPLTSLHSIVQILKSEEHVDEALLDKGLDNISINVKRLLQISRRLVKFSRVGDEPRRRFAVDDAIDEALSVLDQRGALQHIEVTRRRGANVVVHGNIGQVGEIFLNLCVNAIQAMDARGRLEIVTRAAGHMLEVLVIDSGPGVDADVVMRIFEPFFTTRADAQGTGLGLSISSEFAREHGGTIQLRHTSPSGASFCVALPREQT